MFIIIIITNSRAPVGAEAHRRDGAEVLQLMQQLPARDLVYFLSLIVWFLVFIFAFLFICLYFFSLLPGRDLAKTNTTTTTNDNNEQHKQ